MKYGYLLLLTILLSCKKDEADHPDIQSGLVVNLPLDGTAYDSVSATTGTVHSAVPVNNRHGEIGKAMLFTRTDSSFIDFGDLSAASFPSNQFTVSFWMNVIDTVSPVAILSKRGSTGPWEYSIDNHFNKSVFNFDNWISDGTKTVYGTDPLDASASFQLNTWQHVAYVADGQSLRVYLNGVMQTGEDAYQSGYFFSDTDGHLVIGDGGGYGKHYFFNGCIDDVRMYNRALDVATIAYLASM